ncbi:type II toxin-antitoxin system RelE/ParE family toxin [Methylocystis sp. MJC1]|uniref:type II toxin-antitoxin system RelE/ParE family toxin n=1 Tax=Methylocystis sp. MJC1 TaxID=2654282 RepID=UPI001FEEE31A|nr:type II toxin-antitoxin system RelE/ParE family toxin [Methylocystis sp. MJC1]UZX13663.1 type II toxin-antitoxin system RelE/ParE family toxin [Methylocystis sp. MJC1]
MSEDSEHAATRLLERVKKACVRLLEFPLSGASREQLGCGLRVIFQGNYAIYYLVQAREVVVVRVLHGARDAAALAEQGGFAAN